MSLLGLLGGPITSVLEKFIPDTNARREASELMEKTILEVSAQADKDQNAINLEQAKHDSLFVAGPRPFIMWVCGFGLAYSAIGQPMLQDILSAVYGAAAPKLTPVDQEVLMPITMALLGLGGARSFEKFKNVSRESLRLKRGIFSQFRRKN